MSFYRTYRPQVLDEIDNEAVREHLTLLLRKDRKDLPHAFLFHGPKGTGKTTAARLVAKIFNCEKLSKREGPCGKCEQCRSIAAGNNLDILEIDAASNRGIDEIRTLREQIALSPISGDFKIYIIDEVHMLTTEAFNALLKTLEEPPRHAVFVLATTDVHKVPATIVSRAVTIAFARATPEELVTSLRRIVRKEHIDIDKDATAEIANAADGSFRDAAKFLEQVSLSRGKITESTIRKILTLSEDREVDLFLQELEKGDAKEALSRIAELTVKGVDVQAFVTDCLHELHLRLMQHWTDEQLRERIQKLSRAFVEIKSSPIPSLPLELAVVELCEEKKTNAQSDLLTLEKLEEHWPDFIAALKSYNHSVAAVLRSARPKSVKDGIVTIEAFYKFHLEKLSEPKTKDMLAATLKKLFGEKVIINVIEGRKS